MPDTPLPPEDPEGLEDNGEIEEPVVFKLRFEYVENNEVVAGRSQGYRIGLKAAVESGFRDADVFRYLRISDEEALLSGVCSPSDLIELGQEPHPQTGMFRADRLDLVFPSQDQAYEIRDEMLAEIEVLCCEMARITNSVTPATILEISSE